jgi:hypothetical protein
MTKIATGRTRPDLLAELGAWIGRLEAALAPVATGDIAAIDHLAQTIRQGWAVYDRLPQDPRGEQLVMLLRRANAVMATVEDVLDGVRLVTG